MYVHYVCICIYTSIVVSHSVPNDNSDCYKCGGNACPLWYSTEYNVNFLPPLVNWPSVLQRWNRWCKRDDICQDLKGCFLHRWEMCRCSLEWHWWLGWGWSWGTRLCPSQSGLWGRRIQRIIKWSSIACIAQETNFNLFGIIVVSCSVRSLEGITHQPMNVYNSGQIHTGRHE